MSAKNLDPKGRLRSETIAYRCSPAERKELDKRWKLMGYVSLSLDQSARIKEASRKGYLNADFLRDYLSEKKPKPRKVVFNQKKLDNYFTPDMSNEDIEELIVRLLDEWKEKGEQH